MNTSVAAVQTLKISGDEPGSLIDPQRSISLGGVTAAEGFCLAHDRAMVRYLQFDTAHRNPTKANHDGHWLAERLMV